MAFTLYYRLKSIKNIIPSKNDDASSALQVQAFNSFAFESALFEYE